MTVIEASSGTYRSRVDGTIVLSVEISPIHRSAALALFGMPGTPLAIAALKVGHAAIADEPPKADKPDSTLSRWAALRCKEEPFQRWVAQRTNFIADQVDEMQAATFIRETCRVESRADLDQDAEAAARFHQLVRIPYSAYLQQPRHGTRSNDHAE